MKKMSKNVLFIVIGILVAFTIDVAAEAVISSGAVSYSNTTVSAALDELFSAVDINTKIGTTDISTIGDGTITGAINNINNNSMKVALIKKAVNTSAETGILGSAYAYIDISDKIAELGDINVKSIVPIGAYCGSTSGRAAILAPYINDWATEKTTKWTITAPSVDSYVAAFVVFYY